MLKDYLKDHKISMYALAEKSGIAYSTINDIANGRVDIDNCKLCVVRAVAQALGISIEDLCNEALPKYHAHSSEYNVDINIYTRNKDYYADFVFMGIEYRIRLCPVNIINTEMINDIAEFAAEDYIENLIFERTEIQ